MNIAFIPARCGSKSIPFKNIKEICGQPLIYWSLKALSDAQAIDQIYVATDCDEVKSVVLDFNLNKVQVYDRNKKNASDTASTESVMLEFIQNKSFDDDDRFILVQATSPFVSSHDFSKAIIQLENDKADSLLTCVRTKNFFWNKAGNAINYDYNKRPRRQDFAGTLMENGAFYINSITNIKQFRNRLSGRISIYEMPEFTAIEADEEDDWPIMESLMFKNIIQAENSPQNIKLFVTDVDGVLTDAGMYYDENGNELKKFNTHDGMGFKLLREHGIKTAIITSENTNIVKNRAKKLKADYLYQGQHNQEKLDAILQICENEKIGLHEVAFIGDDINDKEALEKIGLLACPKNAMKTIKNIPNIIQLKNLGGHGVVREFIEIILNRRSPFKNKS